MCYLIFNIGYNQGLITNVIFIYFIAYLFMFNKQVDYLDILLNTLLQHMILMYRLSLFYLYLLLILPIKLINCISLIFLF
jgi:hypothetical protein